MDFGYAAHAQSAQKRTPFSVQLFFFSVSLQFLIWPVEGK
jgi:hypothetical protein